MKITFFKKIPFKFVYKVLTFFLIAFLFFWVTTSGVKADVCGTGWYCYGSIYITQRVGCEIKLTSTGAPYCSQIYDQWANYNCSSDTCSYTYYEGICDGGAPPCTWQTVKKTWGCCAKIPDPYCGDGSCNGTETCSTCSSDCGSCCTTSCPTKCGQADGCGGTCASTDSGVPGIPVIEAPVDPVIVTEGNLGILVNWTDTTRADKWDVEIYESGKSCATDPKSICLDNIINSQRLISSAIYPTYFARVRALNDTCSTEYSNWRSLTFNVLGQVSGTVYNDPNNQAAVVGGICSLADPKTGQRPGPGSYVTVGVGSTAVNPNGTFSLTVPIGSIQVAELFIGNPAVWDCNCPLALGHCAYSTTVPKSGLDYFVSNIKDAWWQAEGGNVHAAGSVSSKVPNTADLKYLITGESGLASYGTSLSMGSALGVNQSGLTWKAQTSYQGLVTKYAYFERILEDDPQDFYVFSGGKPNQGNGVYFSVDISTSGSWSVSSGEVYVILVAGNVTITDNIIVNPGGFLAIIASGNIIISNNVTNVEGVYVADGVINTGTSNEQLLAEGSFVAWQGFNLSGRDFGTALNNTDPVIKFKYRPDLVLNAYQYLLKPRMTWAEVAP